MRCRPARPVRPGQPYILGSPEFKGIASFVSYPDPASYPSRQHQIRSLKGLLAMPNNPNVLLVTLENPPWPWLCPGPGVVMTVITACSLRHALQASYGSDSSPERMPAEHDGHRTWCQIPPFWTGGAARSTATTESGRDSMVPWERHWLTCVRLVSEVVSIAPADDRFAAMRCEVEFAGRAKRSARDGGRVRAGLQPGPSSSTICCHGADAHYRCRRGSQPDRTAACSIRWEGAARPGLRVPNSGSEPYSSSSSPSRLLAASALACKGPRRECVPPNGLEVCASKAPTQSVGDRI
jgi:hypothetical protein